MEGDGETAVDRLRNLQLSLDEREREVAALEDMRAQLERVLRLKDSAVQALSEQCEAKERRLAERTATHDARLAEFESAKADLAAAQTETAQQDAAMAQLSRERAGALRADEALDALLRTELAAQAERRRGDGLARDVRAARAAQRTKEREYIKSKQALDEARRTSGWAGIPPADAGAQAEAVRMRCTELAAVAARLEEEDRTCRAIVRRKGQLCETLAAEVAAHKSATEDLAALLARLRVAERDEAELAAELDAARAAQAERDDAIAAAQRARDAADAAAPLEEDKDFLRGEVARLLEQRHRSELASREAERVLSCVESRVAAVAAAAADIGVRDRALRAAFVGPAVPVALPAGVAAEELGRHAAEVDAELAEVVGAALGTMRRALALKETLLGEKVANISALQAKIDAVVGEKEAEAQLWAEEARGYRQSASELRRGVAAYQTQVVERVDGLRVVGAGLSARRVGVA